MFLGNDVDTLPAVRSIELRCPFYSSLFSRRSTGDEKALNKMKELITPPFLYLNFLLTETSKHCKLTLAMKKTLGSRIRELREEKDYSLREFAKKLGNVSAAHISDIELGRRYPSEALLQKIASLLAVSIEELQQYDNRAPVEEIKRLSESDPAFGFALRKLIEKDVTPEDILNLTKKKPDRDKKN